jgi:YqaJ-like viral recombinase domain
MLKKAHISPTDFRTDEGYEKWRRDRLAKFTSSEIHYLTYPTGFTEGSINYIRRKVGEELTGEPARQDFETDATRHGLLYEADAIHKFGVKKGLQFIVVQQLIANPETRCGSTPDGLILVRESPDKTEYEVETVEVKCPPSYDGYIGLFECDTPMQLKKENRIYYWQVLDQMDNCGSTRGHFVIYHPKFKAGNHKSITFNPLDPVVDDKGKKTFPIHADLKLLRERKDMALVKFDQIRAKLMSVAAL